MALSTYTNDVMKALPAALRPNPWNIDEDVMLAMSNGWSAQALAAASYATTRNPTPALVVTNLRNLSKYSPDHTKPAQGWAYGHLPCTDHKDCELCRCIVGTVTHEQPVPMPQWVKQEMFA